MTCARCAEAPRAPLCALCFPCLRDPAYEAEWARASMSADPARHLESIEGWRGLTASRAADAEAFPVPLSAARRAAGTAVYVSSGGDAA